MTRRKEWLARAVLAVGAPLLFFGLLESTLRLAGYGFPAGFFVRMTGRDAWVTNQKFGWRFFPPSLARTPVPAALAGHKASGTYRIFVLGESAAMGFPEPAFSFGRILQAALSERYPGVAFEIVNAAMTAINSHAILPIARDCAARQPDLLVVLMGNNEVVGPYGPGTVFRGYAENRALIRTSIWLGSLRLGEWVTGQLQNRGDANREWRGMAMFLDRQVPADDPRLETVYRHFRSNLDGIIGAAKGSGAQVIVSTIPVNLKDTPPFASVHGRSLTDIAAWQRIFGAAKKAESSGDLETASQAYEKALLLDDGFAETHFRLARCLLALGRQSAALAHFGRARDLDALRFRADSRINGEIREAAAHAGNAVVLVDSERIFQRDSIPGDNRFFEHVHLNFDGNYLLASSIFDAAVAGLPAWVRGHDKGATPSQEDVAARLPLTGWDRYRMAFDIYQTMEQPPFPSDPATRAARAGRLEQLRREGSSPEALRDARQRYEAALAARPSDLLLRQRLAELLQASGDPAAAVAQWRELAGRIPGVLYWQTGLASALADQGRTDESVSQFRRALLLDPQSPTTHFSLATVLDKANRFDDAAAEYSEALRFRPTYAEAHNNLGRMLARHGRAEDALHHYREALRLKPGFAEAHNNLGLLFAARGQTAEAVAEYREAIRLRYDFAGAHYNLSAALAGAGRLPEAAHHLDEALRFQPDFAEAHYSLGAILLARGDPQQALPHLAEAVRLKPGFAQAYNSLGVALARQGRLEQAAQNFSEALRLRPDFAQARANLQQTQSHRR